jgi:hypothetical protein
VIGAGHKQVIVTLVERKSGYARLMKVSHKTSEQVSGAVVQKLRSISARVKTITFDSRKEFAEHARIDQALGSTTYFADPLSSWQRGRNRTTVRRTILNNLQRANATGYALRIKESDRKKKGNEQTAIVIHSWKQSIQRKPLVKNQSAQVISIKSAQTLYQQ